MAASGFGASSHHFLDMWKGCNQDRHRQKSEECSSDFRKVDEVSRYGDERVAVIYDGTTDNRRENHIWL